MSLMDSKAWDFTSKDYDQFAEDVTVVYGKKGVVLSGLEEDLKTSTSTIQVLDVAAGPGTLAVRITEMAIKNNYKVKILSTDFSEKMIEVGKAKITKEFKDYIDMQVMDGQDLTVSDSSFDYCFSIFGALMFKNRIKGLQEMHRVLKKGGKAIVTGWIDTEVNTIFFDVICDMGIKLELANVLNFGSEEVMVSELKQAGFEKIKTFAEKSTVKFVYSDFWTFFSSNPFMQSMWKHVGDRKEEFNSKSKDEIMKKLSKDGVSIEYQTAALIGVAEK